MDRHTFEELATAYVLGALDPKDKAAFEEVLQHADDEQLQLVRNLIKTSHSLAVAVQQETVSADVKDRLMHEVAALEADERVSAKPAFSVFDRLASLFGLHKPAFALAIASFLIIITIGSLFYASTLNHELEIAKHQLDVIEQEFRAEQQKAGLFFSPELSLTEMRAPDDESEVFGKVVWCRQNQNAVLQLANVEILPDDKVYQLWIIKDGEAISAGTFDTEGRSWITIYIEKMVETNPEVMDAFAVTMESKGEISQPSGDMILVGRI